MAELKTIFFDAGNTLVFADTARTLAPLHEAGVVPTRQQLHAAERGARRQRDAAAAHGARLADEQYWQIYYRALLAELRLHPADLLDPLVRATRHSANWECVPPGTRAALLRLKQRFRLGVISNSDGRMADLIARVGLGDCFDDVTDSGSVGFEKPDPRIFQAALRSLGAAPGESAYIGDVYSIDYLGAIGAGMQAILFDVCGAYRGRELPRVESLDDLLAQLLAAP